MDLAERLKILENKWVNYYGLFKKFRENEKALDALDSDFKLYYGNFQTTKKAECKTESKIISHFLLDAMAFFNTPYHRFKIKEINIKELDIAKLDYSKHYKILREADLNFKKYIHIEKEEVLNKIKRLKCAGYDVIIDFLNDFQSIL